MSTITKEQLRKRARQKVKSLEFAVTQTAFSDTHAELEEELELARIALASLEAE
ncbi:TPA: DNA-binding protein, partial [Enterobacter hormaechei]|nr:DNA-binding protein [Enterobacter hormaechei]